MDQHPDALAPMRAALAATDAAARAVAMELDYWLSMTPALNIPTSLLIKVDDFREKEADMFRFLPNDGISHEQTERAWKQAVEQAEAMTGNALHHESTERHADGSATFTFLVDGLTQDQEPCNICGFTPDKQDQDEEDPYTQYQAGLLSADEFIQVAKDSHLRAWIVEKLS